MANALEKRTAGEPLSDAEHQQRVDAAKRRWSGATLAVGGAGAAAVGYAAAVRRRRARARDQTHIDAHEPIQSGPLPTIPRKFTDAAARLNEGRAPGTAKIDATALWFLDGDKKVYANANNVGTSRRASGSRAAELDAYPSIRNAAGRARVWFKPGEQAAAERALRACSGFPPGTIETNPAAHAAYHREMGSSLGYPHEAVERYTRERLRMAGHNPDRYPPAGAIQNTRGRALDAAVKSGGPARDALFAAIRRTVVRLARMR